MGTGRQIHQCLQSDCEAEFDITWEDDPEDWSKPMTVALKYADSLGWQAVSLPGKLRFLCPLHHDPNAPTR